MSRGRRIRDEDLLLDDELPPPPPQAAVEGFPELIDVQRQCSVCTLLRTNPMVLRVVHELYRRGERGRPLMAKIKPVFEEAKEVMPARQSFLRHFEIHCSFPEDELKRRLEEVQASRIDAATSLDDQASDYFALRKLYADFEQIFIDVREDFQSAREKKQKTSDYGLVMLVKLAGELRNMLKTLSDMRSSEKIISGAIEKSVELAIARLTEPLGAELRQVRDRLTNGESAADVALVLAKMLDGELYPLFQNAATAAIEETKQQYKLH